MTPGQVDVGQQVTTDPRSRGEMVETPDAHEVDPHVIAETDDARMTDEGVEIEGSLALTISQAATTASDTPTTVVLIAGEAEAGKTTLLTELWASFLKGPVAGWSFAGSRTLAAFSRRHFPARESSGQPTPTTERTADQDMRLLHLRLVAAGKTLSILASDVRGEYFEAVIDGAITGSSVSMAARADKCIIVLDGDRMDEPGARRLALFRIRSLVGGLVSSGGLRSGVPILLVCAKSDCLTAEAKEWLRVELGKLAVELGGENGRLSGYLLASARPRDPHESPSGLDDILTWIAGKQERASLEPPKLVDIPKREFWQEEGSP